MGRRRNDGASVNLFPFLSILVAIIGCLTLIIVVMTLSSMNKVEGKTPDEVVRAKAYMELKKEKEKDQAEQDKLKQTIKDLIQDSEKNIAARDKLKLLKNMLDNQEVIEESRTELINEFNILSQTNKQLDESDKLLKEDIKKKEEEIARRKLPPEPAKLRVTSIGSSSTVKPYFVEIGGRSVLIHRSLTKEPTVIPLVGLNQSPEFVALLKEIGSNPRHKLNFLVRGDFEAVNGLEFTSKIVRDFNKANGTDIIPGKLPLPSMGKVDLQTFAQFLEP
ncbi:MAG: hypothetical protein ACKVJU_01200 [Verrucomicrobiales bacterium]